MALAKRQCDIQGNPFIFPTVSSRCRPKELRVYHLYGILSKIAVCVRGSCVCTCAAAHTLQSLSAA